MASGCNRLQLQASHSSPLNRRDVITIALLILTVLVTKWSILPTPYHWDEMGAYFEPARWLSARSLWDMLPGRHPAELFFGHPPLLYLLSAALFKLFNATPLVAHAVAIFFASLGVLYTYLLGRFLVSFRVGLGGAILLFSFPLYFAQSGMLLGDIPITALGVMAVYYRVLGKSFVYTFCATLMVLTKETSILLVLILILVETVQVLKGGKRWQLLLSHLMPVLALTIFFVMQKIYTGSFLPNPFFQHDSLVTLVPGRLLWKGAFACYWAFFAQWRFLLTGTIIVACIRMHWRPPDFFLLFAGISLAYVFAFTCIYFLPRYMLLVAPFVSLAAAASLNFMFTDSRKYFLGLALPVVLAVAIPPYKQSGFDSFETTMQYLDVIGANKSAAYFLENNHAGKTVLASWPLMSVLADPGFGYVKKPVTVTTDVNACWDLIAVSPQGDQKMVNSLRQVIAEHHLTLLRAFTNNGKVVEIYQWQKKGQQKGKIGC